MTTASLAEARAYCRAYTRRHSENFSVATLFLPRRLLPHFHAVYAYCRYSDDLGDKNGGDALRLLGDWRKQVLAMLSGEAEHPILIALADTIRRFSIPREPFLDLLSAFEQDQTVHRYDTHDDLLDYCRRSANPVGRILLHLFECCDDRRLALSDHICTALQLTNFWQDVARDFAIGRVYLPQEDRVRFGYGDDDLEHRRFTPAFAELMRFEVGRTRELFGQGLPLVGLVPPAVRIDVELFARGGLAVLNKIERQGYNVWQCRPRLTKFDKTTLMLRVIGRLWRQRISPRSASFAR